MYDVGDKRQVDHELGRAKERGHDGRPEVGGAVDVVDLLAETQWITVFCCWVLLPLIIIKIQNGPSLTLRQAYWLVFRGHVTASTTIT